MAITIKPDALAATVADLLNEYGDECTDILEDAVKKTAKQPRQHMKQ